MSIKERVLDSIYPRCCPICHQVVKKGNIICEECIEKIQPIQQPRCMKCGKALTISEKEYCEDCKRGTHWFDQGMGIYPYGDVMRQSIEKFKFHGRREYGDFYVEAMVHYGAGALQRWKPDNLMFVPMVPSSQRRRGFNQAEYLADGLSRCTQIPVNAHGIRRIKGGKAQKELNARQRRSNLSSAFALTDNSFRGKKVLVVDDIYTTGSTIDAIASLLKKNGALQVYFLTLCQGKGL